MKMKHHKPSGDVDLTDWELGSSSLFYKHFEKIADKIEKSIKTIQKDLERASAWNFQDKLMIDVSRSVDFTLKEEPNGIDFCIKLNGKNELIAVVGLPLSENDVRFTAKIDQCLEDLSYMDDEDGIIYRSDMAKALRKLADKIDKNIPKG